MRNDHAALDFAKITDPFVNGRLRSYQRKEIIFMKFRRKGNYNIVTSLGRNDRAIEFANKYASEGTTVDVVAHGNLLKGGNIVEVRFKSDEKPDNIKVRFLEEIESIYNPRVGRVTMFM